jgi:hypothetical protein
VAPRRYLYEAKGDDGKVKCGYMAADTLAHAREQLLALGLREVALIDDDLTAELRVFGERAGSVEPGADMDLALRYRPTAWSVAWLALRANGIWVVAALLLAAYLWSAGSPGWALALVALVLLPATFPAWVQWRENEILREFWRGNYESSERIARAMRAMRFVSRSPIAQLELDGRIAAAMAKRGDLAGAIAQLEPWQGSDKVPAPTPLVKLANVYFLARDWPRYIQAQDRILESTQADFARIDLAQVLARMGDDDARAAALLDSVDVRALGPLQLAFIGWGRGVLALRAGRDEAALRELAQAVNEMQKMGGNPLVWGALALSTGYLCVAMARCGLRERARAMFASVQPIVERHGEDRLLEWLRAAGLLSRSDP